MTPERLDQCLFLLRWRKETLAEVIGCQGFLVEAWTSGKTRIPEELADWLERLAKAHMESPPGNWRRRLNPAPARVPGSKVWVFETINWNLVARGIVVSDARFRTIESIHLSGGEPDFQTGKEVAVETIDDNGVYRPT